MPKVGIIRFGMGNIFSVKNAVEICGGTAVFIEHRAEFQDCDRIILPGVGAFNRAVENLDALELIEPIQRFAESGKAVLGICLGMQLLFENGHEGGKCKGLGIVKGDVEKIPCTLSDQTRRLKTNIGWRKLLRPDGKEQEKSETFFDSYYYFVHSYAAINVPKDNVLGRILHSETSITAAVQKDNVVGYQFHPEKSGVAGLKLISNFITRTDC